jgi:hypothetical protein
VARPRGVTGAKRVAARGTAVLPTFCRVGIDFPGPVMNILLSPQTVIAVWGPVQLSEPLLFNAAGQHAVWLP